MKTITREYLKEVFPEFYELLKKDDESPLADGCYMCDGVACNFQSYDTKALQKGRFEAHEKMVDVQYLRAGKEIIGVAPINAMELEEAYNAKCDVAFYKTPERFESYVLNPGEGMILFPEDGHMPGIDGEAGNTTHNLKVVVKVPVDSELFKKL